MYLRNQHDAHVLDYLKYRLKWRQVPWAWRLVIAVLVWFKVAAHYPGVRKPQF